MFATYEQYGKYFFNSAGAADFLRDGQKEHLPCSKQVGGIWSNNI